MNHVSHSPLLSPVLPSKPASSFLPLASTTPSVSQNDWTRMSHIRSSGQNTSCASSTQRKETGKSLTLKHPSVLHFMSKLHLCLIPCNPVVGNWKITVMHLIFYLFYVIWNCSEYVTVTSALMQKISSAAISWRFCWGTGQSVSVFYLEPSIHTAADFQQKRLNAGQVMSSLMEEQYASICKICALEKKKPFAGFCMLIFRVGFWLIKQQPSNSLNLSRIPPLYMSS